MSLLQYCRPANRSSQTENDVPVFVPSHTPQHTESGLSTKEHDNVVTAVSDLADPSITTTKRRKRGNIYSVQMKCVQE